VITARYSAALLIVLLATVIACSPPDDKIYLERFNEHRHVFDELRGMIIEDDGLVCVNSKYYNHKDNLYHSHYTQSQYLSKARWQEYRNRFRTLKLDNGICRLLDDDRRQSDTVRYAADSCGFVFAGWSKGYYFKEGDVSPLVDSLDRGVPPGSSYAYRQIEKNWYLILEAN
jgi:hypothetical protein